MNVLIVGASRGLGLEFVRQYRAAGAVVTATARSASALAVLRALGATGIEVDVADAGSIERLASQMEASASFDVAVICAGVYGPQGGAQDAPSDAEFDAVMHTNVLGPMRVIRQLGRRLAPGAKLAVISSRMGAIEAREGGSASLYRASKAAVNSVLKNASLELGAKAVCVSLHPGWVRTDMGGPGADLTPEQSVAGMRRVIATLTPGDNGRFFNHDASVIAW